MTMKKTSIITASVVIPIVIFGIFVGSTDFLKEDVLPLETEEIPVYVPSNITKANPHFVIIQGEASIAPMTASQRAEHIKFTLEGTVKNIDEPVLYVYSNGNVKAAIPITMSVEKVYKGNPNSDTFTFYLSVWAVFIDGYLATSYSAIGEDTPFLTPHYKDFTVSEIVNSKNIRYGIHSYSAQFEIDDKIIIHIGEDKSRSNTLDDGNAVMITEYDLTPFFSTNRGQSDVYKIQNNVIFNHQGILTQNSEIRNESLGSP